MASGLSNKLTGQIGEFLACAELGKRGLVATPFSGNVPAFDIIVADELCRTLPIQVKTSRSDNWPADARDWMKIELDSMTGRQNYSGPKVIDNSDLIYICISIAVSPEERDRFFVLKKSDIQNAVVEGYSAWMEKRDWIRPRNPASFDARYAIPAISQFENNWTLVTEQLQSGKPKLTSPDE